jgi:hypothetical protein
MMTLDQLAVNALEAGGLPGGLEGVWQRAALSVVATSRGVDPPLDELIRLTTPESAWADLPRWPSESIDDRVGRLCDSHRLAIALGNDVWLSQLDACWSSAVAIDPLTVLRARGEIGLALGGLGWQPDDLEMLIDAEFLIPSAPGDRAWLSLARRDLTGARWHLGELETLLTTALQRWRDAPDDGIRQVRTYPGAVLRVEPRALASLVDRNHVTA